MTAVIAPTSLRSASSQRVRPVRSQPPLSRPAQGVSGNLAAVLAAVVALGVAIVVASRIVMALGGAPASTSERHPNNPQIHVVQPGESMWSIAQSARPDADIATIVRAMVVANGGSTLQVGQQLAIPL